MWRITSFWWNIGLLLQRFLPSEFGHDVDRADPVEPGLTMYNEKRRVRRYVEAAGIPYTYICCNSIAAWPYHDNTHPADVLPPLDRFHIYGDGSIKGTIDGVKTLGRGSCRFSPTSRSLCPLVELSKFQHSCCQLCLGGSGLLVSTDRTPHLVCSALQMHHSIFWLHINLHLDLTIPKF